MTFNLDKWTKIYSLAVNPGSSEAESRTAAIKALRMIENAKPNSDGINVDIIWRSKNTEEYVSQHTGENFRKQIYDANQQLENEKLRNEELLKENSKLQQEQNSNESERQGLLELLAMLRLDVSNLEKENAALRKEYAEVSACQFEGNIVSVSDTERQYVSFDVIEAKARKRLDRKYTKSLLAFELEISTKTLTAWQTVGIVPIDLVNKVEEFSRDQLEPASRTHWSEDEVTKLKEVLCEGLSDLEAARTLSTQFGRRRFEPNVARKRRQLAENGWKPSPNDRSSSAWSKDDIIHPDVPDLEVDQTQFPQHHAKSRYDTPGKAVP